MYNNTETPAHLQNFYCNKFVNYYQKLYSLAKTHISVTKLFKYIVLFPPYS